MKRSAPRLDSGSPIGRRALNVSQARLRTLVESLSLGVVVVDENRRVSLMNEKWSEMFGLPHPSELHGMHAFEIPKIAYADAEKEQRIVEETIASRTPVRNVEVRLANGRIIERDYAPIEMESGAAGHVWMAREITEQRRFEAELRAARDAAEDASRAKDAFCAMLSHELRTPLGAILGSTELLLRACVEGEQKQSLQVISRSGEALLTLINDLLDYAKIRAGKFELEDRTFDLVSTVREAAEALRPNVGRKPLSLSVSIESEAAHVVGDPTRIRQVVSNLVGNALKFTEEGEVVVVLVDAGAEGFRVEVRDTGPGVPEQIRGRLFEPFTDADPWRRSGRRTGSGLGLSITRELVERMGGSVTYRDREGGGSVFTLNLPLRRVEAPKERAQSIPAAPISTGMKVLLAEDEPFNARVARKMLELHGCEVDTVANGEDAVAAALRGGYALVFMDCQMPRLDGLEATRRIRAAGSNVPIVAMTANAMRGDRDRCLEAGMDGFLAKPATIKDLAVCLGQFARAPEPAAKDPAAATLDDTLTTSIGATSGPLVTELATLFFEDARRRVSMVEDAFARANYADLGRAIHALKGASAAFGAAQLRAHCLEIENATREGAPERAASRIEALRGDLAATEDVARARGWLAS